MADDLTPRAPGTPGEDSMTVQHYRCLVCLRRGTATAFTWLKPLTEQQRAAGSAAGAPIPDPPVVPAPVVHCPVCVVNHRGIGRVVDANGNPAASHEPPTVPSRGIQEEASRIARRASGVPSGRMGHGQARY